MARECGMHAAAKMSEELNKKGHSPLLSKFVISTKLMVVGTCCPDNGVMGLLN